MRAITDIERDLIADFSLFDTPMGRYEYLIDLGKTLPDLSDEYKTEDHIVKGCQSNVWLRSYTKEDRLYFQADSDAIITKGLVGLLVQVLSGQTPADIATAELHFIDEIGLRQLLSPNRSNGLSAMIQTMKHHAERARAPS